MIPRDCDHSVAICSDHSCSDRASGSLAALSPRLRCAPTLERCKQLLAAVLVLSVSAAGSCSAQRISTGRLASSTTSRINPAPSCNISQQRILNLAPCCARERAVHKSSRKPRRTQSALVGALRLVAMRKHALTLTCTHEGLRGCLQYSVQMRCVEHASGGNTLDAVWVVDTWRPCTGVRWGGMRNRMNEKGFWKHRNDLEEMRITAHCAIILCTCDGKGKMSHPPEANPGLRTGS